MQVRKKMKFEPPTYTEQPPSLRFLLYDRKKTWYTYNSQNRAKV